MVENPFYSLMITKTFTLTRQKKSWFFEPSQSSGSLDDEIFTVNMVAYTMAEFTRYPGDNAFHKTLLRNLIRTFWWARLSIHERNDWHGHQALQWRIVYKGDFVAIIITTIFSQRHNHIVTGKSRESYLWRSWQWVASSCWYRGWAWRCPQVG